MQQVGYCCKFGFKILLLEQQKEAPPISGAANVGIFRKNSTSGIKALSAQAEVFPGHIPIALSETAR
jgi:hypothetical protein